MDPPINFETPESVAVPFRKLCDDSGYLSTTPDSAGVSWARSGATASRHSDVYDRNAKRPCPRYRKYQDLYDDSPAQQLYTPEVTFPLSFKAKRMTLRKHKSLPISGEESQVIEDFLPEPLAKLSYDCEEDMVIDEDLHNLDFDESQHHKHQENEVELDPGNCSMYEEVDMSCNGEESSFVDMKEVNTLEQESLTLNNLGLSVDFNTPPVKTVLPVTNRLSCTGVEIEEVSKEVPHVEMKEVSKNIPPVFHNWRDNLVLKNGSKMLDDFADRKSTVDFLYYLGVASDHSSIVSRILSFVPQCDLTALTRVSKNWRSVVTSDKPSRRRIAKARRIILTPEKENSLKNKKEDNGARVGALLPIGNFHGDLPSATPSAPSSTKRSDSFYEQARRMKDGYRNDRCAKCDGCAAVHIETAIGRCPSPCDYVYCARCKTADHRPAPCVCVGDLNLWDAAQYRKARICSKNSKRRLLRL